MNDGERKRIGRPVLGVYGKWTTNNAELWPGKETVDMAGENVATIVQKRKRRLGKGRFVHLGYRCSSTLVASRDYYRIFARSESSKCPPGVVVRLLAGHPSW